MKSKSSIKRGTLSFAVITTIAALLVIGALPLTAMAAEAGASTDVPKTIEREYRYQDGQGPPIIPETIVDEGGNKYQLLSYDAPVADPSYARPTQSYTRQYSTDIPKDDINNLSYYFAASFYIEDGPFVGNIPPAANPYYIIGIYEIFVGQVDRYHTIENLPDNDAMRIPMQMDFTVSSSEGLEATQAATLDLLSIEYEITGTNVLGRPNNYTAYLTYRGQESWLELLGYNVTAYYAGTITSNVEQYVIRSQYELIVEPVAAVAPAVIPPIATPTMPAQEIAQMQPINLDPVIAATVITVVLVLVWLLVWLLLLRKNTCLVQIIDENRKVLLRRYLSVAAGEASFVIPDEVELYGSASYVIELKPRLAMQEGELLVTWRDRIIARDTLKASIQIDKGTIVIDAVIGVISEVPAVITGTTTEA